MFKFSILSAFRRKTVSVLAIIGVGLGSGLLVVLLSLSGGIESRFNTTFQSLSGTISVSSEGGSLFGRFLGTTGDPIPKSYADKIAGLEGIDSAASFVSAPVRSDKFGPLGSFGVGLTGVIEGGELFGNPNQNIVEGRSFEKDNEIIAGSEIFDVSRFADFDLKVGDKVTVPIGSTRETLDLKLVGIFKTGEPTNDNGLFANEKTARDLANLKENQISGILVRVSNPEEVNDIAKNIEEVFKESDPLVSAFVPANIFESLSSFLDVFNLFLLSISLVAAAAGGTAVMVVMLLTVFERRQEFGILKAGGWSNRNVIVSVVITSLTLSILGAGVGLLVGSGAALGLQKLAGAVSDRQFIAFTWDIFAWAAGVGIVTGLLGGIIPAVSAARVSPIKTLRGE